MNEVSGAFYEHYGGYPVPHTDHEWLGVLHYGPVVEEFLLRRFGRPALARWLARARRAAARVRPWRGRWRARARRVERRARRAADRAPPEHAGDITDLRDESFLRWRYFEGPDAARALSTSIDRSVASARSWPSTCARAGRAARFAR